MQISFFQNNVSAVERAQDAPSQEAEIKKVAELSQEFEAVFLRQILKDVRKSVIKSELTPESAGSDIYQDMVTNQLAENISKSGSFGFARSLEAELTRKVREQAGKEGAVEK